MPAPISITLSVNVIDRFKFGRAAWRAAQNGGFTSLQDWRDYRKSRGVAAVIAELLSDDEPLHKCGLELTDYTP